MLDIDFSSFSPNNSRDLLGSSGSRPYTVKENVMLPYSPHWWQARASEQLAQGQGWYVTMKRLQTVLFYLSLLVLVIVLVLVN